IVTKYINILGYTNLEKYLGFDASGDKLYADQIFIKNNVVYLVEQKIRDDHDSTKKRGQYSNFDKKVRLLESKYGNMRIIAIMWFIDDGLKKNINYYLNEMKNSKYKDTEIHLYYGSEFFSSLENGDKAWQELCSHLRMNRKQNSGEIITIPDFGSSAEIYNALLKLPQKHWNKLLSNDKQYILLRDEMFSTGSNLDRAKKARS
ncbi:MAG: restriction endonuclease, partial [Bacteroidales bacterium]|nr:restriction endonuclease [Bacteroidales bacterium]